MSDPATRWVALDGNGALLPLGGGASCYKAPPSLVERVEQEIPGSADDIVRALNDRYRQRWIAEHLDGMGWAIPAPRYRWRFFTLDADGGLLLFVRPRFSLRSLWEGSGQLLKLALGCVLVFFGSTIPLGGKAEARARRASERIADIVGIIYGLLLIAGFCGGMIYGAFLIAQRIVRLAS